MFGKCVVEVFRRGIYKLVILWRMDVVVHFEETLNATSTSTADEIDFFFSSRA